MSMANGTYNSNPDDIEEGGLDFGNEVEGDPDAADPNVLAELAQGDDGAADDGADDGAGTATDDGAAAGGNAAQGEGRGSAAVPYSRFKEVNDSLKVEREQRIRMEERLRMLEERATAPTQQAAPAQSAAPAFDMKAKVKERNAAILEGDDDKAAEIEMEIESYRLSEAERRAEAKMQAKLQQRDAEDASTALQRKAIEIVDAYPFLDSTSPAADAELIADVRDLRDVYIARGKSPVQALEAAVAKLKGELDAKLGKPAGAATKTPEQIAAERRAGAVQRNAGAAQPPRGAGVGAAATPDVPNVMDMSADDWEKLPESERAKLLA